MMKKMRINKIILLLLVICLIFLISGCKKDEPDIVNMSNTQGVASDDSLYNIDVSASGNLFCTREALMPDGMSGEFKYYISYEDGIINIFHSMEKVISNDSSQLDEYEKSYNTIKDRYKDLKYYDITITRDDNSVTYDSNANYDKINFDELIDIEGNENHLYDDNHLKLKTWYNYVKDFGVSCQGVVS